MKWIIWLLTPLSLQSATYYLGGTGASDSNNCTAAQSGSTPKATFSSAWGCLSAGDTLSVRDGSYSSASPPTGKAGGSGSPIIVTAENDGGVLVSGTMTFRNTSYITVIGFKVTGSSTAVDIFSNGTGLVSHHLIFQRLAFTCTDTTLNDAACFQMSDGTHDVLLEDSWGWGGGRYTVMCYGGPGGSPPNTTCDNNTFRRVVLRVGPTTSTSGNPQACLSIYYSSSNIVENVICVDGQPASNSSNAAFYITGHAPPPNANSNQFLGVIALNTDFQGWYLDCAGATCSSNTLKDSVLWASGDYAAITLGGTCSSVVIDHNTLAEAQGNSGFRNDACSGVAITNNAFYSNDTFGAIQGGSGSIGANNNNGYSGNTSGARSGISAGSGDVTSNPGFLYITQIESASPYKGAGSGGTDIGANVLNRYVDGTLTGTALWPWPYQARIRTDMCGSGAGSTYGWCAGSKTLSAYIWEYLGNSCPEGICEASGGSTPSSRTTGGVRLTGGLQIK